MKINTHQKIESCVCKGVDREVLELVHIGPMKGFEGPQAVASDGRMMAIVPVRVEEGERLDKAARLSVDHLKKARKLARKKYEAELRLGDSVAFEDQSTAPLPECQVKAPKFEHVIPTVKPDAPTISFNVKLLAKVAEALGSEEINIRFDDEKSPILIEATDKRNCPGMGILMPCRVA